MSKFVIIYTLRTLSKELEFDMQKMEEKDFTAVTFSRFSAKDADFSTFIVNLSFEANTLKQAERVAALNTEHSLVVLNKDVNLIGYHLKLSEKLKLWQSKVLFQKLYSSAS
jgi:hypothetical protein